VPKRRHDAVACGPEGVHVFFGFFLCIFFMYGCVLIKKNHKPKPMPQAADNAVAYKSNPLSPPQ